MNELLTSIREAAITYAPTIGAALLVLLAGWIVAVLASSAVRSLLRKTKIHQKLKDWFAEDTAGSSIDIPRTIGRCVFWVVIVLTLIAVTQTLDLTLAAGPLSGLTNQIFEYLPRIFGAGLLLLLAWIIARIVKLVASKLLNAAGIDKRVAKSVESSSTKPASLSRSVSETLYWLVFLFFLPAILGALQLNGILAPVQGMLDNLLGFLPNLFGATLIALVGWFVARIVRSIITNLISAAGGDRITDRFGMAPLSKIVGLVVYVLILVPVGIGALNALQLDSITSPASNMLSQVLESVPSIFAASVVLIIGFILGRFLSGFISKLLSGIGFDSLPEKLGMRKSVSAGGRSLSELVGLIAMTAIMLFAAVEAAELLSLDVLSNLVSDVMVFGGKLLLGLIILLLGLYLANLAVMAVRSSGSKSSSLMPSIIRVAILVLFGSMAVRQMGIADDIVNLAFGLTLGAVAVSAAIAFGIGGRELAAKKLNEWNRESNETLHDSQ